MAVTVLHGHDQSGPTANRPANAPNGFAYFDTTLGFMIFRDETNSKWRDAIGSDLAVGVLQLSGTGAPVNGTSGTGAGIAAPGCIYTRTSNGARYKNAGTLDSPTWSSL